MSNQLCGSQAHEFHDEEGAAEEGGAKEGGRTPWPTPRQEIKKMRAMMRARRRHGGKSDFQWIVD